MKLIYWVLMLLICAPNSFAAKICKLGEESVDPDVVGKVNSCLSQLPTRHSEMHFYFTTNGKLRVAESRDSNDIVYSFNGGGFIYPGKKCDTFSDINVDRLLETISVDALLDSKKTPSTFATKFKSCFDGVEMDCAKGNDSSKITSAINRLMNDKLHIENNIIRLEKQTGFR